MRGLISFVVVAVTVIVQLTVVDRIAFPGDAGPNLVLLAVAALALAGGPLIGVLTGFCAGLALDVAPPGSHFVGQDALVFCLIGYACGLLAEDSSGDSAADQGHTALFEIVVTAAGAVCGEALAALLGVMLSDPRVTWPAIRNVLPAAVAYDVLLCPFVLYAVAAALRLAGARGEGRRAGWSASQARTPVPGANQGAIRQLAGGNSLRLRVSGRDKGPRTSVAAYRDGHSAGASKVRFGGRRREGVFGGSLLGSASSGGSAFRGSGLGGSGLGGSGLGGSALRGSALRGSGLGLGGSRFGSSSMGRSLLGGSVFSRSSSSRSLSSALGRPAPLGRSSPLRHRGNLLRSAGGGLAGRTPRFSRGGSSARLAGVLRRSAGPKSPGRGWLRGASARGNSLGSHPLGGNSLGGKWLGRGAFGRRRMGRAFRGPRVWAGPGTPRLKAARPGRSGRFGSTRLRMPRPKAKRRWRTGGYR